jgi:RHS repeat-associated protein
MRPSTFILHNSSNRAYAFGSAVKERTASFTQKYRFGFNNQEQEIELGEYYSFEYRVHDARLGRFLSVDPLSDEYPWNSVYAFAENRIIDGRDLEGSEWQPVGKDGNNLPIGDKGITGYKWAGYERQTGFTNTNTGTQNVNWVPKAGTLANPPPITLGNYTYNWSSDPNSRSGTAYMKWNGGTRNTARPLDGKDIELQFNQQENGSSTVFYRSISLKCPGAPKSVFTELSNKVWKPVTAVNSQNGSRTLELFDGTGMRASEMALRANNQESPNFPYNVAADKSNASSLPNPALGDGAEGLYAIYGGVRAGISVIKAVRSFVAVSGTAAKTGANLSTNGVNLSRHLGQLENYGQGGFKELQNGRFRYYGNIKTATNVGEMQGARLVREWNPANGNTRTWYETLDHAGKIRQVHPKYNNLPHYKFDASGKYIGKW